MTALAPSPILSWRGAFLVFCCLFFSLAPPHTQFPVCSLLISLQTIGGLDDSPPVCVWYFLLFACVLCAVSCLRLHASHISNHVQQRCRLPRLDALRLYHRTLRHQQDQSHLHRQRRLSPRTILHLRPMHHPILHRWRNHRLRSRRSNRPLLGRRTHLPKRYLVRL